MTDISKHITLDEATRSNYAILHNIPNVPGEKELQAMQHLAEVVFEPLREAIHAPIFLNSFYRAPLLNTLIGGASNSEHVLGQAMDIHADAPVTNKQLFDYIFANLPFNQLIWEFGTGSNPTWVHVSLSAGTNKHQVLQSINRNGKTIYIDITKTYKA